MGWLEVGVAAIFPGHHTLNGWLDFERKGLSAVIPNLLFADQIHGPTSQRVERWQFPHYSRSPSMFV